MSDEGIDEVKSISHSGLADMMAVSFAIVEGQFPFQHVASLVKKTPSLKVAVYPNQNII